MEGHRLTIAQFSDIHCGHIMFDADLMDSTIEEIIGLDPDLVDVTSMSRWDSIEAVEQATATPQYQDALEELRKLFAQTPIVPHFGLVE